MYFFYLTQCCVKRVFYMESHCHQRQSIKTLESKRGEKDTTDGRWDLNPRPLAWYANVLPIRLPPPTYIRSLSLTSSASSVFIYHTIDGNARSMEKCLCGGGRGFFLTSRRRMIVVGAAAVAMVTMRKPRWFRFEPIPHGMGIFPSIAHCHQLCGI